jgi:hypothetical protein
MQKYIVFMITNVIVQYHIVIIELI